MNSVSKANERQVAGTHYKGVAIQHWDYAAANGLDYFEGQITKYVCRWRKKWPTAKGRLDDIAKALHFAEKFAEVTGDPTRTLGVINTAVWMEAARIVGQPQYASYIRAVDFCDAQELSADDSYVIVTLELYRLRGGDYLHNAIRMLQALVAEATRLAQLEEQQVDPAALADNAAVDVLAAAMKAELEVKRLQGRGGWATRDSGSLLGHAARHAEAAARCVDSLLPGHVVASANYLAFTLATHTEEQLAAPGAGYVNQD